MALRLALVLGTLYAVLGPAPAQELAAFKDERAAASKADPAADLAAADALAVKAEAALKAGNAAAAGRLARDARWTLPAGPVGLPPNVEKVLGYTRLRHADQVNAVAYFPDGRRLASVSRDGSVRVWNLDNGREVAVYRKFPAPPDEQKEKDNVLRVPAVSVSPDGKTVAAAGGPEVHLWNPDTGTARVIKAGGKSVWAVAFGPGGKLLATVAGDNVVRLWDAAAGKETKSYPALAARAEGMAFAPDGRLAVVDASGMLTVYATDADDAKPKLTVRVTDGSEQPARAVAFAADGRFFTGGEDKTPRLSGPTGAALVRFPGHTARVSAVAAAGALLLSAGDDRAVRVWDAATGKLVRLYQGHLKEVTALAVRPDGKQFVSAGADGGIRVWDLSTSDEHRSLTEATDHLWAAAYSPDGNRFAVAGADRVVRVYDAVTGKVTHSLKGHTAAVTSVVFLPDRRLASAGGDRVIRLWNADGTPAKPLDGHTSAVLALAVGPNGLLVSGAADKTVRGWDTKAGKQLWIWTGRSPVAAVAVRADGKRLAVGATDGSLTILDVGSPEPKALHTAAGHLAGVAATAYSPDGTSLATAGGDGLARLWTVTGDGPPVAARQFETGAKPAQPGASVALSAAAFSPDGRQLAAGGADGVVHIWSVLTGVEARALRGHADWVTAVAFAPTGDAVLAAGVDRSARVFDLPKGDAGKGGHTAAARAVAVSRDGKWAVSGGNDLTVRVWALPGGAELATLPGAVLPTYAVAPLGPDRLFAGAEDGSVKLFTVRPPAEVRSDAVGGSVYNLTADPAGTRLGVWTTTSQGASVFSRLTADGKPAGDPLTVKDADVRCAAFAPDLSRVVLGTGGGTVRVYDLTTRERVGDDWVAFPKAKVGDVAFTADGTGLIAVSVDGTVKVADAATKTERAAGPGPKADAEDVMGVAASPAGGRFAAFGADGDVRLFDAAAKELRAWKLPVPANGLAFTPDGKRLLTANADGTLYVLACP